MIYLNPDVHVALFQEAVIALHVRKGNYLIYGTDIAQALIEAIKSGSVLYDNNSQLSKLKSDGVIGSKSNTKSVLYDYSKTTFSGFTTTVWANREFEKEKTCSANIIRDQFHVSYICLLLKLRGFCAVEKLSKPYSPQFAITNPDSHIIKNEVTKLYSTILWSPFKIACLEWSFSVVSRLHALGIAAKLVVGVRPMPFQAHAWPEVNGHVIADAPNLRSIYGVIYESL